MENLKLSLEELHQINSNKKSEELREKLRLHTRKVEVENIILDTVGAVFPVQFYEKEQYVKFKLPEYFGFNLSMFMAMAKRLKADLKNISVSKYGDWVITGIKF